MIIDKPEYRRNKHGDISKRQIVTIKCDICGKEWDSAFEHRKRKKHKNDRCSSCRMKVKHVPASERKPPVKITCSVCGKRFFRFSRLIKNKNYCSRECLRKSTLDKYFHLSKSFAKNPNEVAYLFGLILGDGHLKQSEKFTTKICIAFDRKYPELIRLATDILNKLEIKNSLQPVVQLHCQIINFTLPNNLLKKYNMLWSGGKYESQPSPKMKIINNIEFASGLFNSDGYSGKTRGRWDRMGFCNTCLSIVNALKQSLKKSHIFFREYSYQPKPDKRTGHVPKLSYQIVLSKKKNIERFRRLSSFLSK